MFCAKCGGAIPEGGGFCVKCGAPARPIVTTDGRLERPGVVTFLAVLQFISAAIWLLSSILGLALTIADTPAERDPTAVIVFGLMLSLGALQLACGIGLWKLKPYGRWLQIAGSCIGLVAFPVGTIISVVILVYLNKPGIKLLFSGKPVESYTPEELSAVAAATTSSGAVAVLVAIVAVLVLVTFVGIIAAIAVPGLLRARMSGNEAVAIGQLRGFTTAETSYAIGNRLLYDRPECLLRPTDCLAGYSGPPFLQERAEVKSGYRFAFHPGAPPSPLPSGASASSMTTFVLTAAPVSSATGARLFCVDHTGEVRAAPLTAEIVTAGPTCPANWLVVR